MIIIIIYPYRPPFGPTKCWNLGGVNFTIQDGLIHDISIVVHLSLIFVSAGFCVRRDLIGQINARLGSIKGKLWSPHSAEVCFLYRFSNYLTPSIIFYHYKRLNHKLLLDLGGCCTILIFERLVERKSYYDRRRSSYKND